MEENHMKKIISLGIASAVCALTAISASAAGATLLAEGEVSNGKTITVKVVAGEDVKELAFVVKADGLDVESVKTDAAGMGNYNAETKKYAIIGSNAKAGDTICTITFKVTAENGKTASVLLEAAEDKYAALVPESELKLDVKGATTDTSDTSSTTSTSEPTSSGTTSGTTSDPSKPTNPGTGVALAVVPAVIAAAGVIVAKKRK